MTNGCFARRNASLLRTRHLDGVGPHPHASSARGSLRSLPRGVFVFSVSSIFSSVGLGFLATLRREGPINFILRPARLRALGPFSLPRRARTARIAGHSAQFQPVARYRKVRTALAAGIVVAGLSIPYPGGPAAGAQQATFRATVDLVAVDVQVVDRDGLPIPDPGPKEFEVTIDGESAASSPPISSGA